MIGLSGWLLGLLFRVSPVDQGPVARPFNEALYFFEQSGVVLWLFAALALGRLRLRGALAAAAIAAGLLAALPTTIQFVVQKRRVEPMRLSADAVAAARALAADSEPGDVVLQRPELQRFPPAPFLVGRRLPFTRFIPFYSQFLSRDERLARYSSVRRFFETPDPEEALALARELGARYVLLYGRDALSCDPEGLLEPVYEAERARLYRIRLGDEEASVP